MVSEVRLKLYGGNVNEEKFIQFGDGGKKI